MGRVKRLKPAYRIRALVVDDVAQNREVLAELLKSLGIAASIANNGNDGVALAIAETPDIVFLDIRMPGMDGMEAAQLLRSKFRDDQGDANGVPKLIAISASVLEHERKQYLNGGFDAFLPKPFQLDDVCGQLRELLGVEFEYDSGDDQGPKDLSAVDIEGLNGKTIPAEIWQRLHAAAEIGNVTQLQRCCREIEGLDGASQKVGRYLQGFVESCDLESLPRALEQLQMK